MIAYAVNWLDNRSRQDLISRIFSKMKQNFRDFIEHTDEVPFGYAERSIVGQIAIAAHDTDCYTLQDYDVSIRGKLPKDKKRRYRPDLWVMTKDGKQDYVFEVKGDYIPVSTSQDRLGNRVSRILSEAKTQLSRHGWSEGKYQCALVALRINCAPSKWSSYGNNSNSFDSISKKLGKITGSIDWGNYETKPNFFFQYMIPYDTAKRLCKKNEKGQEQPPLLGILCFGLIKRIN